MACNPRTTTEVPLRVLPEKTPRVIGWGRRWRWRLTVLVIVQVAMILHILVWWIGLPLGWKTLSPVEPSEAIETVADGIINAGAIFFALALLSTAVLGRWFCGWGCHVVLLQDWCLRLLRKAGIRPRAFRSRLLMMAPLALACYMFLWPIAYRLVWAPIVEGRTPAWHGFSLELLTRDLWATMPGFWVAVVFLFLCGFVTVYVLGAKGFCTYACPYGGFFAPIDRLSLRRVTVSDACEGCAHCTAACTSNVRVHEQVATWGKVIDVGCMKTTDCIEACPNDALAMQWSRPAIAPVRREGAPRPSRTWDLSMAGEITLAIVMILAFLAWRGAYGLVPMLMSLGAASVMTWLLWKSWRVLSDAHGSFHRRVLKKQGRLTGAGVRFLAVTGVALLLTLQAAASQGAGWRADQLAAGLRQRVTAPPKRGAVLTGAESQRAAEALRWYRRAGSLWHGGIGLADDPNHLRAAARLHVGLGELQQASRLLDATAAIAKPNEDLAEERFMVRLAIQSPEDVASWVDAVLLDQIDWHRLRRTSVQWALSRGDLALAGRLSSGPDVLKYAALSALGRGDLGVAVQQLNRYVAAVPGDALAWITLARIQLAEGDVAAADGAAAQAESAAGALDESAAADLQRELAAYRAERAAVELRQPAP